MSESLDATTEGRPGSAAKRPKRDRRRIAGSEVWLQLAMTAQRWADQVADKPGSGTLPFAEWPDDDEHRRLCRVYDLTPGDLSKLLTGIADQLERRALRAGYEEANVDD